MLSEGLFRGERLRDRALDRQIGIAPEWARAASGLPGARHASPFPALAMEFFSEVAFGDLDRRGRLGLGRSEIILVDPTPPSGGAGD